MFVENKSDVFRQGDIVTKMYFTAPAFYVPKGDQVTITHGQTKLNISYLVLVSNCCELQWYEDDSGRKRPRRPQILVAPLSLKIHFEQGSEEYNKLIKNGENTIENDPVQYFYFEDNTIIGCESVIDLSTIMPMKSSVLKERGTRKLLELEVKHRHLLRKRLREYLSRIPAEEEAEVQRLFRDEFG